MTPEDSSNSFLYDKLYACGRVLSEESFKFRHKKVEALAKSLSSSDSIETVYNYLYAQDRVTASSLEISAHEMRERSHLLPKLPESVSERNKIKNDRDLLESVEFLKTSSKPYEDFMRNVRQQSSEVGKELYFEEYSHKQNMVALGTLVNFVANGNEIAIEKLSGMRQHEIKSLVKDAAANPLIFDEFRKDIPFFKNPSKPGHMDYVREHFSTAERGKSKPPTSVMVFRKVMSKAVSETPFGMMSDHFYKKPDPMTGVFPTTARSRIVNTIATALDNKNIDSVENLFMDFMKNREIDNVVNLHRTLLVSKTNADIEKSFSNMPETVYSVAVLAIGSDMQSRELTSHIKSKSSASGLER